MRYSRGDTIFRTREPFSESFIPDRIVGRETERDQIKECLSPIVNLGQPNNIFIYGGQGVGKSVCVNYELQELQTGVDSFDDVHLATAEVNCNGCRSSYQVAIKLANTLLPRSKQLSQNGTSKDRVFSELFAELNTMTTNDEGVHDYIVILLDEVDYIGSDDDLLYQFSRAGKANTLTATVCVIGLSNQIGFHRDLSDSTLSTLKPRDITFGEYASGTIQAILWDRIDLAFSNGVVDESAVALAASTAASDGGDARIGLDLIEEAGDIARLEDDDLVTDDHVRVAVERTKDREIINQLTAIRDQHKVIIAALLKATLTNAVPIGRTNLFVEYRMYAEELLGEFHTSRWLHDQLVDLSKRNIVTVIHRGHGNQYELNINPDLTVKGLRQASIEGGIPAIPNEPGELLNKHGWDLSEGTEYHQLL